MKNILLTFFSIFLTFSVFSQLPQAFKYQAAVRRTNGDMVVNQAVAFKISILTGSVSGSVAYSERQPATTNQFGLVTLEIGRGIVLSGNFLTISWGATTHFVKVEVDTTGGTNYLFMGTSELLSVPYSFSATTATDDFDRDSTNEIQTLSKPNDTTISLSSNGGSVSIASAGIPSGFCIISNNPNPPPGFSFTGKSFETTESSGWNIMEPAPNFGFEAAVSLNGKIYALGYQINLVYDPSTNSWATRTGINVGSFAAVVLNEKIYVIGGASGGSWSNSLYEYNTINNIWTPKANMPTARGQLAAAVCNGKIYAFGGINAGHSNVVEEYNPVTNSWTTKNPMSYSRDNMGAVSINNKIYVIGGNLDGTSECNLNDEYDPILDTWTAKSPMSIKRESFAITVSNNQIYAIGGSGGNPLADLTINEKYDPITNTWTIKAPLDQGLDDSVGASINNSIYIIGGNQSPWNINRRYLASQSTYYIHCKN